MNRNSRYTSKIYLKSFDIVRRLSDDIFELKQTLFDLFQNQDSLIARAEIIDNSTGDIIHRYQKDEFS